MNINLITDEITFELSESVRVAGSDVSEIVLKKPHYEIMGKFENLLGKYNSSIMNRITSLSKDRPEMDPEEAKKIQDEQALKSITNESILEDAEQSLEILSASDFDFIKAYREFQSMLLSKGKRGPLCRIADDGIKSGTVEDVIENDPHEFKLIMVVYLTFFAVPTKRRKSVNVGSERQLTSQSEAQEL
jgi:hypothetical protein